MGKTRLLRELAGRGDALGHIVLSGSAAELEADLPFWVFVDALDEYLQALEQRRLDALGPETLADLAGVFPSLQSAADGATAGGDRYRMHRAVRQLLETLAATKPLVLVLDDLHWADHASLELLGSLLRRPPDAPVLLAVALRPRQLDEGLGGALERARGAGVVTRLELGALSADEARQLLGSAVTGAEAEALYEESAGNPFYLQQLARSPQSTTSASRNGGGVSMAGVEVPGAVAAALRGELALLSEDDRRVLEGAAVAGDPFEPELAAAAAGVSEPEAINALDELLLRDLVRPTEVPRRFRFRHPLVRGAVYEAAPGGWRLGAHERMRGGAGCARCSGHDPCAPRGALGPSRRHGGDRSAAGGGLGQHRACAGLRGGPVPRGPEAVARRRTARGARTATRGDRRGSHSVRGALSRGTRRCAKASSCARGCGAGAREAHCGAGVARESDRPASRRARAACRSAGGASRPVVSRRRGADDRARYRRLLSHGLLGDARLLPACRRGGPRDSVTRS